MARTKTTGDAASFMPAAGDGVSIKFYEEEKVRIENRKVKVPVQLKGKESNTERATSFLLLLARWILKPATSLLSRGLLILRIMRTQV